MSGLGTLTTGTEHRDERLESFIASPAFEALVSDTGADVALVDSQGKLRYLSPRTTLWPAPVDGVAAGKSISDFMRRDLADERLAYVRKCIETGASVALSTMWRGVRAVSTFRRVRIDGMPEPLVLITCRAIPDDIEMSTLVKPGVIMAHAQKVDLGPLATLTPREMEVLALIGQGMTTEQIAKALFRSRKTVEAHRLSLGLKLRARNRVELARVALRSGLTTTLPARLRTQRRPGEEPAVDNGHTHGHSTGHASGHGHANGHEPSARPIVDGDRDD